MTELIQIENPKSNDSAECAGASGQSHPVKPWQNVRELRFSCGGYFDV